MADPAAFYTGTLGAEFVEAARAGVNEVTGKYGLLSMEDLYGYRAVYREPVQHLRHFLDQQWARCYFLSGNYGLC